LQAKSYLVIHITLMFCLAWQDLVAPFHGAGFGHDYCLSYLNFHVYNITQKTGFVKDYFIYFAL